MAKRTLDTFFNPTAKKSKSTPTATNITPSTSPPSVHPTYPFPIPQLPPQILETLNFSPENEGHAINDQPDLDLLYFQPYIPSSISKELFQFLRQELFFYRVKYKIQRGGFETDINTPRFTTVFGVDETARFCSSGAATTTTASSTSNPTTSCDGDAILVDDKTGKPLPKGTYKCAPRPIPACLDYLRTLTEGSTNEKYNFCLVNYYANGDDSISYHSDDERFLGINPAIASFSLGAKRDFLMKHKPSPAAPTTTEQQDKDTRPKDKVKEEKPLRLPLGPGDMILMRGKTQANWLHSIPKRKGGESGEGRINITFRRAMVRGGTENYYRYNVGVGEVYKWDEAMGKMVVWESGKGNGDETGSAKDEVKKEGNEVKNDGHGVKKEDMDRGYAAL